MKTILVLAVMVATVCIGTVYGANNDPCAGITPVTWVEVPEAQWSNKTTGTYPVGYRLGSFGEDNMPPYCLNVNNVRNKKVEIMMEAQNKDARICVKDTSNPISVNDPGTVAQCGAGKVHACFPASTLVTQMNLVVYCDTGCTSGTVSFYHRVRISDVAWTDNNNDAITNVEMWCMMQDTKADTIYPSDLIQDFPDVEEKAPANGAATTRPLLLLAPLLAAIAALLR